MVAAGAVQSAFCVFAFVRAWDVAVRVCLRREFVRLCAQGGQLDGF